MNRPVTSDETDELLTSYLDQELSPEERARLEQRLVDDQPLRQRLAEMRRAWELLDELPETPFTPNFTQSTLEMVALDLEKERATEQRFMGALWPSWIPKVAWPWPYSLGLLIAGSLLVGGLVGMGIRSHHLSQEAHDIAVASRLDALKEFSDLDELRKLQVIPGWETLLENEAIRIKALTELPNAADRQSIVEYTHRLDADQRENLWKQLESLRKLNTDERASIEQRYQAMQKQDDRAELEQLAIVMNALLQSMPMNRRDEIRSLDDARKVVELRHEASNRIAETYGSKLVAAEKQHIRNWKFSELMPELRSSYNFPLEFRDDGLLYYWMMEMNSARRQDPAIDHEALVNSFCAGLKPETVQLLECLTPKDQLRAVARWTVEGGPEPARTATKDELYQFYKSLDHGERDGFDLMHPDDVEKQLRIELGQQQRKMLRNGGKGGPGGPGGPPGPPDGMPRREGGPPPPFGNRPVDGGFPPPDRLRGPGSGPFDPRPAPPQQSQRR